MKLGTTYYAFSCVWFAFQLRLLLLLSGVQWFEILLFYGVFLDAAAETTNINIKDSRNLFISIVCEYIPVYCVKKMSGISPSPDFTVSVKDR